MTTGEGPVVGSDAMPERLDRVDVELAERTVSLKCSRLVKPVVAERTSKPAARLSERWAEPCVGGRGTGLRPSWVDAGYRTARLLAIWLPLALFLYALMFAVAAHGT